jgi:hypothetical protein
MPDNRRPDRVAEAIREAVAMFLAEGVKIAVVEVATPPFVLRELNNPEDVEPIEQALAEAGLE